MSQNPNAKVTKEELILRDFAMAYPGATEDFPWGHRAIKVNKKAFIFMATDDDGRWGLSVKLPVTGGMALSLPFCEPTGYGMAKYGWVSVTLNGKKKPPLELVKKFIDESYRAIAPKRLVKQLDGGAAATKTAAKKPPKKVAARKR